MRPQIREVSRAVAPVGSLALRFATTFLFAFALMTPDP